MKDEDRIVGPLEYRLRTFEKFLGILGNRIYIIESARPYDGQFSVTDRRNHFLIDESNDHYSGKTIAFVLGSHQDIHYWIVPIGSLSFFLKVPEFSPGTAGEMIKSDKIAETGSFINCPDCFNTEFPGMYVGLGLHGISPCLACGGTKKVYKDAG